MRKPEHEPGYLRLFRKGNPHYEEEAPLVGRGVIVRHLVLPEDIADSYRVINIISEISPRISVTIMDQYHPEYRASEYPGLLRRPAIREIQKLKTYAASRVTLLRR